MHLVGKDDRVRAEMIAREELIPLRFLLKLVRKLVTAGIIKSHRGRSGGYSLAKPADQITVLETVEAVSGKISFNRCILEPAACSLHRTETCSFHHFFVELQDEFRAKLLKKNFSELHCTMGESRP
jgi:Rrf2 family protein